MPDKSPFITDDAIVFGLLAFTLLLIFITSASQHRLFRKFYAIVPTLALCYFIPGVFNSLGIIDGGESKLYGVASQYLLPASLVLFTLSLDLKEIWKLRRVAGLMFITASASVLIGGPLAVLIVSAFTPDTLAGQGPDAAWRGLSTIAGSWIGGGANQAAMYEVFKPSPKLFSAAIAVDVIVASIWMGILLYGAAMFEKIDRFFKADASKIDQIKNKMEAARLNMLRIPTTNDTIIIIAVAMSTMGLSQWLAGKIAGTIAERAPYLSKLSLTSEFFWLVLLVTFFGILLSFTKARKLEGVGASRIGSMFLYFLIATIGMKMDIMSIFSNPVLFIIGAVWICIHGIVLIVMAKLTRAPFFFLAVASQANIGGAASAPVVASAFHTSLAPVGVLLAILGYAIGTYGGYVCGILMQWVSNLG